MVLPIVQNSISLLYRKLNFFLNSKICFRTEASFFHKDLLSFSLSLCYRKEYNNLIFFLAIDLRLHSISSSRSLMDTKQSCPLYRFLRGVTLPAGLCTADQYPLSPAIQPIFHPPHCPLIEPLFHQSS